MIKRVWVRRYTSLLSEKDRPFIFQSSDTANEGGPKKDFSVCTTWYRGRANEYLLADCQRRSENVPEGGVKVYQSG